MTSREKDIASFKAGMTVFAFLLFLIFTAIIGVSLFGA